MKYAVLLIGRFAFILQPTLVVAEREAGSVPYSRCLKAALPRAQLIETAHF